MRYEDKFSIPNQTQARSQVLIIKEYDRPKLYLCVCKIIIIITIIIILATLGIEPRVS